MNKKINCISPWPTTCISVSAMSKINCQTLFRLLTLQKYEDFLNPQRSVKCPVQYFVQHVVNCPFSCPIAYVLPLREHF